MKILYHEGEILATEDLLNGISNHEYSKMILNHCYIQEKDERILDIINNDNFEVDSLYVNEMKNHIEVNINIIPHNSDIKRLEIYFYIKEENLGIGQTIGQIKDYELCQYDSIEYDDCHYDFIIS